MGTDDAEQTHVTAEWPNKIKSPNKTLINASGVGVEGVAYIEEQNSLVVAHAHGHHHAIGHHSARRTPGTQTPVPSRRCNDALVRRQRIRRQLRTRDTHTHQTTHIKKSKPDSRSGWRGRSTQTGGSALFGRVLGGKPCVQYSETRQPHLMCAHKPDIHERAHATNTSSTKQESVCVTRDAARARAAQ